MSQSEDATEVTDMNLQELVEAFSSHDGLIREKARDEVVYRGTVATPLLIEALKSKEQRVRWEAAKSLIKIKDPKAADALVTALEDSSFEIQWLAAEALIQLKQDAVKPILRALVDRYESQYLRAGAHHVLHALEREDLLDDNTLPVLDELRDLTPTEPYPMAARRALDAMT